MSNLYQFYREAAIEGVQEKGVLKTLKKSLKNISKVVYITAESLKCISLLKKSSFTCLLKFLDHLFLMAVCGYPRLFKTATETLATSEICSKCDYKDTRPPVVTSFCCLC